MRLGAAALGLLCGALCSCGNTSDSPPLTGFGDNYSFDSSGWELKYHNAGGARFFDFWYNKDRNQWFEANVSTVALEVKSGLLSGDEESQMGNIASQYAESNRLVIPPEPIQINGGNGYWLAYSTGSEQIAVDYLAFFLEGELSYYFVLSGTPLRQDEAESFFDSTVILDTSEFYVSPREESGTGIE